MADAVIGWLDGNGVRPGSTMPPAAGSPAARQRLQDLDARQTGAGALGMPVLVALRVRPDNRMEVVGFRIAANERAARREHFLTPRAHRRGDRDHLRRSRHRA